MPVIRLDSPSSASWNVPPHRPRRRLRCDGRTRLADLLDEHGQTLRRWRNPLAALDYAERHVRSLPAGHRWVGHLSYDLGRHFEVLPDEAEDDLGLPLFHLTLHAPDDARAEAAGGYELSNRSIRSTFSQEAYESAVARAIEYVAAGDVFQVNLSQRFTLGLPAQPHVIYDRLRSEAPAAYGGFLDHGDYALLSNSPELFLHVRPDRRVVTRPIKGTRPNLPGMRGELERSAKDQAELNMIVDLERNDLGRVCEIGSVRVTEPRAIEAHPTVYHGVATVEGRLREDVSFVDLLRATFPGGSVTGAPKIRAMQIIDQLEPVRRGPYCGAIGYLASDGSMEWNVAIRTLVVKDGLAHVQVGGAVVADSTPAAEYAETLVKARAVFAALGTRSP